MLFNITFYLATADMKLCFLRKIQNNQSGYLRKHKLARLHTIIFRLMSYVLCRRTLRSVGIYIICAMNILKGITLTLYLKVKGINIHILFIKEYKYFYKGVIKTHTHSCIIPFFVTYSKSY